MNLFDPALERFPCDWSGSNEGEDCFETRFGSNLGTVTRNQSAQKVSPILRALEEHFEQKMLEHVQAADVGDDRNGRFGMGDVAEVLVRPDSKVHSAGNDSLEESRNHMQVRGLVRNEVVGIEVPFGLGEALDQIDERFAADLDLRVGSRRADRSRVPTKQAERHRETGDETHQ